jgi:hypothetical protein
MVCAQIEIATPAQGTVSGYDSLSTDNIAFKIQTLVGQTICILPLAKYQKNKGYQGFFTAPIKYNKFDNDSGFGMGFTMPVPKDRSLIYAVDNIHAVGSQPDSLEMKHFLVKEVISMPPGDGEHDFLAKNDYYLRLSQPKHSDIYMYGGTIKGVYTVQGYVEKLKLKHLGKTFTARQNIYINDFETGKPFLLRKGSIFTVKQVVISQRTPDVPASEFLLIQDAAQHSVIIDPNLSDWGNLFPNDADRNLFLPTEWRKDFKISAENWNRVLNGEIWLGMTKYEVIAAVGLQSKRTLKNREEHFSESEWESASHLKLSFDGDKLIEFYNNKPYEGAPKPFE